MMRILITGGMGFVGSHLVEAILINNHKPIVLTKSFSKKSNLKKIEHKIAIEKIDVRNSAKLRTCIKKHKPDVIIHLAGQTSHSKSFEDPINDVEVNAKSTLLILETIKKLNIKCRFMLGSTFIVIGRPKKLPVDEETSCNPTTIYGANRLLSEHYCKIYHDVYGLDTVIFRITNAYGPREQYIPNKNAINHLIYKAYMDEKITLFNKGKTLRDLIYISDVVSAILVIMKKGKAGETYWISSGKKTSLYQLGNWLRKLTGVQVEYSESPPYTKKVDVGDFVVNNRKLRLLGWRPEIQLREGIQKTLDYFQSLNTNQHLKYND
jgi:UDP-glucose 4-epimerase